MPEVLTQVSVPAIIYTKAGIRMKEITVFHLNGCPYCAQARKALTELQSTYPEFKELKLKWIEEREDPAVADTYDYYYVPAFFFGKEKQYEARPGETYDECKNSVERVLRAAL